uniref:Serine/threonine protein phosphatase 2A regulatory subunit B beta isoform n=1 Tax=Anthurium amnicola TaxID=1678845 RepID=A0A1D1YX69_9ARAE
MKPPNMEDLVEVITSAEFHPVSCNILAYSSSRGFIRLVDMRQSALCDKNARILQDYEAHGYRSFFTEIIASISDIKFARDGLWDLRMDISPVATYRVHEHLRPRLHELYTNDSIFDKFECCLSGDGRYLATGSYSNMFRVFSHSAGNEDGATLEASKNPNRILNFQSATKAARLLSSITRGHTRRGHDNASSDISNGLPCDLSTKLTHLAWHPTTNFIVCAAVNSLYMYYA